jgi:hypothetical protein
MLGVGCLFLAWVVIPPNAANATCGEECDQQYSSDGDDCHSNFGDDPSDAEDLASCIQDAKDDYRNCLDLRSAAFRYPVGDILVAAAPMRVDRSVVVRRALNCNRRSGWPRHQNAPRTSPAARLMGKSLWAGDAPGLMPP